MRAAPAQGVDVVNFQMSRRAGAAFLALVIIAGQRRGAIGRPLAAAGGLAADCRAVEVIGVARGKPLATHYTHPLLTCHCRASV